MLPSLFSLLCLVLIVPAQTPFRELYQFPNSPFHDIENVAIRPNGQLLLNLITQPTTYILDPTASKPSANLLYTFPDATGLAGITETSSDVFAVVVGNYSVEAFQGVAGSFSIWLLNLNSATPTAKKITSIPQAETLNGMTTVPGSSNLVLVADSALGVVFSVNIATGAYQIAIQNSHFAPTASLPLGVNGIHTLGNTLYFTNSAQGFFAKIPITAEGTSAGEVSIITSDAAGNVYDDFAFDGSGNAFITNHPNSVSEVLPGGIQLTVANSSQIVQPTSAIFGTGTMEICTVYVVTAGSASGTQVVSGQVFAVSLC